MDRLSELLGKLCRTCARANREKLVRSIAAAAPRATLVVRKLPPEVRKTVELDAAPRTARTPPRRTAGTR